jgi:hypothetical protein
VVERHLAKVNVARSNRVTRFRKAKKAQKNRAQKNRKVEQESFWYTPKDG